MKRLMSIFVLMMVLVPTVAPLLVDASSIEDIDREMDRIQRERDELAKKLAANKLKYEDAVNEINALYARKAKIEGQISSSNKTISKLNVEIPKMEEEAENMLVILQRNMNTNFILDALFNPENTMGESFRKTIVSGKLSEQATETVKESIQLKKDLVKEKKSLESKRASLLAEESLQSQLVAQLEKENKETGRSVASQDDIIKALKDQKKLAEDAGCKPTDIFGVDCAFIESSSGFIMPTAGTQITSEYGNRPQFGDFHTGIDVGAPSGKPIYAVASGTVIAKRNYCGNPKTCPLGNYVVIQHNVLGQSYVSAYSHMSSPTPLSLGQRVFATTQVGKVGTTGNSTGNHLHLEINKGNRWAWTTGGSFMNPRSAIKFPPRYQTFSSRYY